MTVRRFTLALIVVASCGRNAEEPFLTPPPPIPAPVPEASAPTDASRVAAAPTPAPTPPQPAPPPPAQPENGPQIRCSHLLVMYRGSMRAPATVTRTQAEARTRAEQALARIRRGEDFAAVARQFSDEPGAAQSGGTLPPFRHGMMVPPFETAAFALPVGGVSGIVETPFGYHVIKRWE